MPGSYSVSPRTLVFLINTGHVLFINRPPEARLFPGLYNGVGGHVEPGEDVLTSARREVREETGLDVSDLSLRCVLHTGGALENQGVIVFVFTAHVQQWQVTESNEGRLFWIPVTRIPELDLLPDLYDLLPRLLEHPKDAEPLYVYHQWGS
jgi:8-oxo-dGTP diphosphatase